MTFNRIKIIALSEFAKNGYEGASLADISSLVGIKKQSIYTHFKGKDELFLALFNDALSNELQFVSDYFAMNQHVSFNELLYGFLLQYQQRYEQDDNTKFFLRTAFFPPSHLKNESIEGGNYYVGKLEDMLIPLFNKAILEKNVSVTVNNEIAAIAFIAVLDGLFVEMLFTSAERSLKRLNASWFVYWRGIRIEGEGN